MFVNLKVLKKLMKDAYKGAGFVAGLLPGGMDDVLGLYIQSGAWAVWVMCGEEPNPLKGFVVEMIGRYPKSEELLKASKSGGIVHEDDDVQVSAHKLIVSQLTEGGEASEVFPLSYAGRCIDLLRTKETRHLFGVASDLLLLFDLDSLNFENGESFPIGPMLSDDDKRVTWYNSHCCLAIHTAAGDLMHIQQAVAWLDAAGSALVEHQYRMPAPEVSTDDVGEEGPDAEEETSDPDIEDDAG